MKKNVRVRRTISETLEKNAGRLVLLAALCLAGALLPSISPLIYASIIDRLIPRGNMSGLAVYIIMLIAIPALSSAVANWRNICSYKVSDAAARGLRERLFSKALSMTPEAFEKIGGSAIAYRITRGSGQVSDVFLNNTVLSLVNSVLTLIMVFIPMFFLDWRLAMGSLAAFPLVWLALRNVKAHVMEKDKALFETLSEGDRRIRESLNGVRAIKLFGGYAKRMRSLTEWLETHALAKLGSVKVHEFERVTLPELCLQLLYGIVFIIGAWLAVLGKLSVGTLVAFIAYLPRAFSGVKELLGIQVNLRSIEPVMDSLEEMLSAQEEEDGEETVGSGGSLSFENVSFTYQGKKEAVLNDISFSVAPGEAVAIVGETGGGKSTILDLIMRLYAPSQGRITLNGRNIREFSLKSYRERFGFVGQEHFLWSETLKNNVVWPAEETDEEKYASACSKAQLSGFIAELPEKDGTMIGEKGQAISGGERQRISLAHAFYGDGSILLLDEPTSALDAHTEAAVRDSLLEMKGKKTMIAVTHRLSTVMQFDRVLVLRDGRFLEQGTPAELISRDGEFRRMCLEQGLLQQ